MRALRSLLCQFLSLFNSFMEGRHPLEAPKGRGGPLKAYGRRNNYTGSREGPTSASHSMSVYSSVTLV